MSVTLDKFDKCRVCDRQSRLAFSMSLLGRMVDYFECGSCGYLQTQAPDWLAEAYSQPINEVDTGIMTRNRLNVGRVIMTLAAYRNLTGTVVDFAGGYGILVRMLRDAGVDASWHDKYSPNLLARGFEAGAAPYGLITAFEVFEHMIEPFHELRQMLTDSPIVLLTTDLIRTAATPSKDWWYLGSEHGQHIGFFRLNTLRWMASNIGCSFDSDGRSVHIFSRPRVPPVWRPLQRLQRLWPLIARIKLASKMNSDFDALRARRNPQ